MLVEEYRVAIELVGKSIRPPEGSNIFEKCIITEMNDCEIVLESYFQGGGKTQHLRYQFTNFLLLFGHWEIVALPERKEFTLKMLQQENLHKQTCIRCGQMLQMIALLGLTNIPACLKCENELYKERT